MPTWPDVIPAQPTTQYCHSVLLTLFKLSKCFTRWNKKAGRLGAAVCCIFTKKSTISPIQKSRSLIQLIRIAQLYFAYSCANNYKTRRNPGRVACRTWVIMWSHLSGNGKKPQLLPPLLVTQRTGQSGFSRKANMTELSEVQCNF